MHYFIILNKKMKILNDINFYFIILTIILLKLSLVSLDCAPSSGGGSGTSICPFINLPIMYGGTNQDTKFFAIDIDSSYNMIIGGETKDNVILSSGTGTQALAVYYGADGLIKWAKYF